MTLGPYEVLEPIGAGGMGEVFRARDAKLNRDVALKVFPMVETEQPAKPFTALNGALLDR